MHPLHRAVFDAISDPTRRAILDLLRGGARPVNSICEHFPISRPAVSKHLRILRRAHLLRERRHGRERIHGLDPRPLRKVDDWLGSYRRFWEANLASLKRHVEAEWAAETGEPRKVVTPRKSVQRRTRRAR